LGQEEITMVQCPEMHCEHVHWRAEVTTSDDGGVMWNSNALRFDDKEGALDYARDLSRRWMLVTRWRAVDEHVPERQPYKAGSEDGAW
jgi:hypothetical protein